LGMFVRCRDEVKSGRESVRGWRGERWEVVSV
jgi:hypothetical protein